MKKVLLGSVLAVASVPSFAAVPTYVSSALTDAQTQFTEYLGAAAPVFLTSIAAVAGILLIAKMIKRAMKG